MLLVLEPMCLNLCLFSGIVLGVQYLFFGTFDIIFRNNYHFKLWQIGLTFLGILVGMLAAVATSPWYVERFKAIFCRRCLIRPYMS